MSWRIHALGGVLTVLTVLSGCGARSRPGDSDSLGPLGPVDGGAEALPLAVDPERPLRDNVVDGDSSNQPPGAQGQPTAPIPGSNFPPSAMPNPSGTVELPGSGGSSGGGGAGGSSAGSGNAGGGGAAAVGTGGGFTSGGTANGASGGTFAGGGAGPGGGASDGGGGSTDGEAPRLWLYVDDGAGALLNLLDETQRFDLPRVNPEDEFLKPWSSDGSSLAYFAGTTLRFVDLASGQILSDQDLGTQATVHGWIAGYGALISYYYEGRPTLYLGNQNGSFVLLSQETEVALAARATGSPVGKAFAYTTESSGVFRVFWVGTSGGVDAPVEIHQAPAELMTTVRWSKDGRWLVFDDTEEDAFYAISEEDPESGAPIGAVDDLLELSPLGDAALIRDGSELDLVGLQGPASFTHTPIDDATRGAVARFSSAGAYVYYPDSNDSGLLRGYTADSLLPGYTLLEFSADCPLTFNGSSRFFYQQCASRGRGFAEGIIDDTGLTTIVHNDTLRDSFALGPTGRCFVNWGDGELDVGQISLPLQVEFTRTAGTDISFVTLSPRDDAVVWVEGGDEVLWLPLNSDCTVSTIPKAVTSGGDVQALHFVGEFP